ncbi:hypothetical protein [Pseudoroseicyclus sp. CXY001]|uniref:hypothetical protein n=1 Tax=Pseudoroseicyclus sp. CXY001 TaxID=3242492 RepID=UPI0035716EEA
MQMTLPSAAFPSAILAGLALAHPALAQQSAEEVAAYELLDRMLNRADAEGPYGTGFRPLGPCRVELRLSQRYAPGTAVDVFTEVDLGDLDMAARNVETAHPLIHALAVPLRAGAPDMTNTLELFDLSGEGRGPFTEKYDATCDEAGCSASQPAREAIFATVGATAAADMKLVEPALVALAAACAPQDDNKGDASDGE